MPEVNRSNKTEQPVGPVRQVSRDRWLEAQKWELSFWKRSQEKHGWRRVVWPLAAPILRAVNWQRAWGDDWNTWWAERFENYAFLPPRLGSAVELGCGPYTNIRLIARGREVDRVVCSDPLIDEYLKFEGRWLAEAHAAGTVEIDDHPIEECPFPAGSFDVVMMINVLDHVRDADACMRVAVDLVGPGGYFLLGQDLSNAEDVRNHPHDVGHPIRLQREDLDPYVAQFETVLRADLGRESGRDPRLHYATLVYAGRKPT